MVGRTPEAEERVDTMDDFLFVVLIVGTVALDLFLVGRLPIRLGRSVQLYRSGLVCDPMGDCHPANVCNLPGRWRIFPSI